MPIFALCLRFGRLVLPYWTDLYIFFSLSFVVTSYACCRSCACVYLGALFSLCVFTLGIICICMSCCPSPLPLFFFSIPWVTVVHPRWTSFVSSLLSSSPVELLVLLCALFLLLRLCGLLCQPVCVHHEFCHLGRVLSASFLGACSLLCSPLRSLHCWSGVMCVRCKSLASCSLAALSFRVYYFS